MFTKIIIGLVILLLAFGAYSFYFSQGGGNRPITIEGTFKTILPMMRTTTSEGFQLYCTPARLKLSIQKDAGLEIDFMLWLDKKKIYFIHHNQESYAEVEFDYVGKGQLKDPEETSFSWEDILEATVDGQYFGEGTGKYFCRKLFKKEGANKYEIWLTRDTKIGRAYIKSLNNIIRIDIYKLIKEMTDDPISAQANVSKDMRPQFRYKDMDYFLIPLKAELVSSAPGMGKVKVQWEAEKISRAGIGKKTFEVPSGYKKIPAKDMLQQLSQAAMPSMMGPTQPRSGTR